jgi:hypothetical protein
MQEGREAPPLPSRAAPGPPLTEWHRRPPAPACTAGHSGRHPGRLRGPPPTAPPGHPADGGAGFRARSVQQRLQRPQNHGGEDPQQPAPCSCCCMAAAGQLAWPVQQAIMARQQTPMIRWRAHLRHPVYDPPVEQEGQLARALGGGAVRAQRPLHALGANDPDPPVAGADL